MTKKERFAAIATIVESADIAEETRTEMVDFLNHQIELLDNRKSSGERKPTAKQVENEGLKARILEILADGRMTCGELAKALDITSQRCSALLRQLGADGTKEVEKVMEKKVAYFSLASDDSE